MMEIEKEDLELQNVIFDGIQFLESITAYYGPEKGMEVWEAIGTAAGREVKGKVFFAMLTGGYNGRISFRAGKAESYGNAVPVIKCIRACTGFGLKEAKDLWDLSKTAPANIKVNPIDHKNVVKELRNLGCELA